jgi:hypothetical protein
MSTVTAPATAAHLAGRVTARHIQLAAAGLVLVQALLRGWTCVRGYFYLDDFVFTGRAMEFPPWSPEYLLEPYNSHLMPGAYAWAWVTTHAFPLGWLPVALVMLALQALVSYLFYRLLVGVFGRRPAILAPLALLTLSPLTLPASLWWAAALNQLPQQLSMVAVVLLHLRHLRTGRLRYAVGAAAALAGGLLFSEKSLLALVLAVGLTLLYFTAGGPVHRVVETLRRHWTAWLLLAAVALPYLWYYRTHVPTPLRPPAAGHDVLELGLQSVFRATLPGLVGGPWQWSPIGYAGGLADPNGLLVLVAATAAAAVVVGTTAANRGAGRAWLLLGAYALVNLVLLAGSRATLVGPIVGTEYRYQTDLALVAALALAFATMPVRGDWRLATPDPLRPRATTRAWFLDHVWTPARSVGLVGPGGGPVLAVAAVGLFVVGSMWSTIAYDGLWVRNPARPYVTTLAADTAAMPDGTLLADAAVPDEVAWGLIGPYNRLSHVTAPFLVADRVLTPGQSGAAIALPDGSGRLDIASVSGVRAAPGAEPGCGWLLGPEPREVRLASTAPDPVAVVRMGYIADHATTLTVRAGATTVRVPVAEGLGTAFLAVEGPVDALSVDATGDTTRVCTDDISVGAPVPVPGTAP